MTPSGVITLLTDFGLTDPYVGVMKGAILSRFRQATLVDLTHGIPPQDIAGAGFWIERSYRWFPKGTVHLVVVDPGVGSGREALVLEVDGHLFVGPDNGVFTAVLGHPGTKRAHRIDAERLGIERLSATFHGRDLFGPAAAVLAGSSTGDLELVGPSREPPAAFVREEAPLSVRDGVHGRIHGSIHGSLSGSVVVTDHFGNLITDIPSVELPADVPWRVRLGGRSLDVVRTYADAEPGQCVALVGSFGTLELAARNASAAELLGAGPGDLVSIEAG
jgi:S-adenosylmethionine hydrolase